MEATLTRSAGGNSVAESFKIWTARILGGAVTLFMLVDGLGKVLRLAPYVQGTVKIGFPEACLRPLGFVTLAITILYAIPRTAVLGALFLTAYLGGATATHVRLGQPFFMPVLFGVIVWGCLYVRDERIRSLLPVSRRRDERSHSHVGA